MDGTFPSNEAAVVMGEFGAKYMSNKSILWMDKLITYLKKIDARDSFYWSLTPNSGNTGGLLMDNWNTSETDKLRALKRLQPYPSKITYNTTSDTICVNGLGKYQASTPTPSISIANQTESEIYVIVMVLLRYEQTANISIDKMDEILINTTRDIMEQTIYELQWDIPSNCIDVEYSNIFIINDIIDETSIASNITASMFVCDASIAWALANITSYKLFTRFESEVEAKVSIDIWDKDLWTRYYLDDKVPSPPNTEDEDSMTPETDYSQIMEYIAAACIVVLCCIGIGGICVHYRRRKKQKDTKDTRNTSKTVDQVNIVINNNNTPKNLEKAPSVSGSAHEDRMVEELFDPGNADHEQENETIGIITQRNDTETFENETETRKDLEGHRATFARDKPLEDMSDNAVAIWVRDKVKLPQYVDNFISNGFDGLDVIMEIEIDELKEIGINLLGHRKRFMKEIAELNHPQLANEGSSLYLQ